MSRDLKEVERQTRGYLREEHLRQKQGPVQSPGGRREWGGGDEQKERGDQSGQRGENWDTRSESRSRPWDRRAVAKAFDLLLSDVESREDSVWKETRLRRGCVTRANAETSGDNSSRSGSGQEELGSGLGKGQVEARRESSISSCFPTGGKQRGPGQGSGFGGGPKCMPVDPSPRPV